MEKNENGMMIERVFDAPREKVWKTWTDPEMIKKWWGPKDFTAPDIRIDFREGGKYLYCMHGRPGTGMDERDFWSGGVFREITPMEKIVLTDYFTDEKGNRVHAKYYGMNENFPEEMTVVVTFEDHESGTKLSLNYPSLGDMPETDRIGMRQGWNQSLDKLAEAMA